MKKIVYLPVLFLILAGFASCKDDKDPAPPKLKKLTKITCTKNEDAAQTVAITYNQSGEIANIKNSNTQIDYFSYNGNNIIVNSLSTGGSGEVELTEIKKINYQLSGNQIVREEESLYNPYATNKEEYVSNIYEYNYVRKNLAQSVWDLARLPQEDGTYKTVGRTSMAQFTWEEQNISTYRFLTNYMIEFNYSNELQPANFPFKVFRTLNPADIEAFSPVNLLMGSTNRNLPDKARWYDITNASVIRAEYIFSYNLIADYVTHMTIVEKVRAENGLLAEENTYVYAFEYNE